MEWFVFNDVDDLGRHEPHAKDRLFPAPHGSIARLLTRSFLQPGLGYLAQLMKGIIKVRES
jgi:hypothetical protein